MFHLNVHVFLLSIWNLGPVSDIFHQFFVCRRSFGALVQPHVEGSLLMEGVQGIAGGIWSGWLGWTDGMSIGGEMWMHDILDCIYKNVPYT